MTTNRIPIEGLECHAIIRVSAEWCDPSPECGDPGGWEVRGYITGAKIGAAVFDRKTAISIMGAEWVRRLEDSTAADHRARLESGPDDRADDLHKEGKAA